MLVAFQGFTAPHGSKKTRQDVQVIIEQFLSLSLTEDSFLSGFF